MQGLFFGCFQPLARTKLVLIFEGVSWQGSGVEYFNFLSEFMMVLLKQLFKICDMQVERCSYFNRFIAGILLNMIIVYQHYYRFSLL